MNKNINTKNAHSLPFLGAMDEYIADLDRERTITKGYSAPETINSYSYRLRALCRWMAQRKVSKTPLKPKKQTQATDMHMEGVKVADFTEEDIKNYLYECAKAGISPKTINARLYSFSPFWKWLNKKYGITDVTEEIIGAKSTQDKRKGVTANHWIIMVEKLEELTNKKPLPHLDFRNMIIFKFMRYFGRRITEVCNLDIDSISVTPEQMILTYTGKGNQKYTKHLPFYGEEGKIQFALKLKDEYKKYLKEVRPIYAAKGIDKKALFLSQKGTRITRQQVERLFKQLLIKCGLQNEGYVPHSLRHGFARQKLDDGVSLRKVQKLMDHSSIKTTERYLDAEEEELTEAMGRGVEED